MRRHLSFRSHGGPCLWARLPPSLPRYPSAGPRKPQGGPPAEPFLGVGGSPSRVWGGAGDSDGGSSGRWGRARSSRQEARRAGRGLLQVFDVPAGGGGVASKTISKAGRSPEKGASFSVGRGLDISKETPLLKGFKRPWPFSQRQITPLPAEPGEGVLGKCFQGDMALSHVTPRVWRLQSHAEFPLPPATVNRPV